MSCYETSWAIVTKVIGNILLKKLFFHKKKRAVKYISFYDFKCRPGIDVCDLNNVQNRGKYRIYTQEKQGEISEIFTHRNT